MPFSLPRRAMLRGLAVVAYAIPVAASAEVALPAGRGAVSLPHLGQRKVASCAETAHQRVKALMGGVPWPRPDNRPAANNRHCG